MTQVVAYLEAIVGADITSFRRGMQDVRRETGILTDDFTGMAGNLAKVGQAMTYAVTTPLLAIGASAVKSATDFDSSMHNINSIAHMTQAEFDKLNKQVLDFGTNTRSGPQAVADSLYEIYSAGVTGEKAFELMTLSVKTAEAGLAGLEKTTNALTATVMAYSKQNLSASDASNIWTKMVQVGVGSLEDFLANAQKVLPLGSALGITFEDLGANAAYLSQQGGGAKKAMTALAMAFSNLLKPNETMKKAFQELGVATGTDLVKKFGSFEGAVIALHQAVKDPIDFNAMFSKTGLEAVLTMINNTDALTKSVADFHNGLNDATQSAWDEQMKSYSASADRFNSSVEGLKIAIGMQLFPILNAVLTPLTSLFTKMAQANPEVLKLAVAFGIAAAAAGPLIWILSSVLSPIGLLIGAVAALAVAFATDFGGIRTSVTNAINTITPILNPFIDKIRALWEVMTGTGVSLENGIRGNMIDNFIQNVEGNLAKVPETQSKKITIKVTAGMTLNDLYYNSEWSTDLQKKFNYDEFIKTALAQIKGGDARWLQTGQSLSFELGVSAWVGSPDERGEAQQKAAIASRFNLQFLGIKEEIQKQYDFIFKGKPLIDDNGLAVDVDKVLPFMSSLRIAVDIAKGVAANWKDTFTTTLRNVGDGISGFVKNLTSGIDWTTMQQIATKIMIVLSTLGLVFGTAVQVLVQLAGKVISAGLPVMGTVIADFINIIAGIVNGNPDVGKDFLKLGIDTVAGINEFVNKIAGTTGTFEEKFMALSGAINTAIQLVISALQGAARDLKLGLNDFLIDVLTKFAQVEDALAKAGLINPIQVDAINVILTNLKIDTDAGKFAKGIEESLRTGGGKGLGDIKIDGTQLRTIVDMGGAKQIADQLTVQGREGLKAAIAKALTNNDKDGILQIALPIAVAGGMDVSKMDYSKLAPDVRQKLVNALRMSLQDTSTTTGPLDAGGLGKALIQGITNEIDMSQSDAWGAVTTMTDGIKEAAEKNLEINSPSKWSQRLAGFVITGLIMGFVAGAVLLVIATNVLALVGVKAPLTAALSPSWSSGVGSNLINGLINGIYGSLPALVIATFGVSSAMAVMEINIVAIGNSLARQMQTIVNTVTGQLNALKSAVQSAAGISVPTGGSGGYNGNATPDSNASGGDGIEGWSWVGERGPELAYFGNKGTVIPTHTIRDAMVNNNSSNSTSNATVIVNGVQDVDKLLFELERRGIKLKR